MTVFQTRIGIGIIAIFMICCDSFAGQFWAYAPEDITLKVEGREEKYLLVLMEFHLAEGKNYFKEDSTLTDDTGTIYYPILEKATNSEAEKFLNQDIVRRKKFVSQSGIDQHVYPDIEGVLGRGVKRSFILYPPVREEAKELMLKIVFMNPKETEKRFFNYKFFKTKKNSWKYDLYYDTKDRPNILE